MPRTEVRRKISKQDTIPDLQALKFRDGEGQKSHCDQTWQIGRNKCLRALKGSKNDFLEEVYKLNLEDE